MNFKKAFYSLFFLLLSFIVYSQNVGNWRDLVSKNQYFLFLDAKTKDIKIIVNDSIIYTGNFKNPKILKKTDYPEGLRNYHFKFNINQKNYFVHDGGGVVLEYSNDSLKRVDRSFLHKNQYGASEFQYKNQIYLFGGYGLFAFKNIITYYDFLNKEWLKVHYTNKERPIEASDRVGVLIGDNFYALGGYIEEDAGSGRKAQYPGELWRFNLKTSEWKKLGNLSLKYGLSGTHKNPTIPDENNLNEIAKNHFIFGNKIYLIGSVNSMIIDPEKNRITYYKSPYEIIEKIFLYNPKDNTINYLDEKKSELISIPVKEYFKTPFDESKLYENPSEILHNLLYVGVAIVLLIFVFYFFMKRKPTSIALQKIKTLKTNTIDYNTKDGLFYHQGFIIQDLAPLEISILKFLYDNNDQYIPINELNSIIEKETAIPSLNSILKKRESVINILKTKLSIMLNVSFDLVILEQKCLEDRRIKEIKLNEKYFKLLD